MFKLKKNKCAVFFYVIVVCFIIYLFITIYRELYQSNDINNDDSYNVEGFNIRQYYNSKKRSFNKVKNKYLQDSKIKIKKFLKKNNII
jgi:hypothetical protein